MCVCKKVCWPAAGALYRLECMLLCQICANMPWCIPQQELRRPSLWYFLRRILCGVEGAFCNKSPNVHGLPFVINCQPEV